MLRSGDDLDAYAEEKKPMPGATKVEFRKLTFVAFVFPSWPPGDVNKGESHCSCIQCLRRKHNSEIKNLAQKAFGKN